MLCAISSAIVMPLIISYFMPAYQNLDNLYFIIIIGLVLKNLAFFPMAYIVAVGLHKYLPIYSAILIIFLGVSYYFAYSLFNLSNAIGYSSVAVVCFIFFIILTSIHIVGFNTLKEYLRIIFRIYMKIFLVTFISIILMNVDNFVLQIPNIYINISLIFLIYLKNFYHLFFDMISFIRGNPEDVLNRFKVS